MEKDRIVGILGEQKLLLPALVNAGLAANERAKLLFTVLQTACWCADHPDLPRPDLKAEKAACDLSEAWLDVAIRGARPNELGYTIPGADRLLRRLFDEVGEMLRPLLAESDPPNAETQAQAERLEALREAAALRGPHVESSLIAQITAVDAFGSDSLHRLVMDLHKDLNALQTRIAGGSIDGAAAYALADDDVALVQAFMQGVNATAPLKFEHPGLGTTATRVDDRLILQNDIGTTDAHVVVIRITGLTATLTYTDIHLERLVFFRTLFGDFNVVWQKIENRQSDALAENGVFHLSIGTLVAADRQELERYLAHIGACLVFLIDWNRARKRLRQLLPKQMTLDLLRWAANNRCGHRAFLILEGDRLIFDTLTFSAKAPLPYGARLDEILGETSAVDYLKFLFSTAAEGLLTGKSQSLIRDQAKAELITRFNSTEELVAALLAKHAGLILAGATALYDLLRLDGEGQAPDIHEQTAQSLKDCESKADQLVIRTRALIKRSGGPDVLRRLIEEADDAIDDVEEAGFLLTLPPMRDAGPAVLQTQRELARLLVAASEEWSKTLTSAPRVRRGGAREDLQCFIETIDHIVDIEHQSDTAERAAKAQLLVLAEDFRQLHVLLEFAAHLESACDALMRAAQILREHILSDIITG